MRWGAATLVSLAIATTVALTPAAGAQSADDALLVDAGPGWTPVACPVPGPAQVCFSGSDGRQLHITASPTPDRVDPAALVEQVAGDQSAAVEGLAPARGTIVPVGDGAYALTLVVAGRTHLFVIGLGVVGSPENAVATLVDLGHRQQDRDGGAPPRRRPVDVAVARELEQRLATLPDGLGFTTYYTGTTTETHDSLRPVAQSQEVIDLLDEHPIAARLFVRADARLVVEVAKHAYDEFAATELGGVLGAGHLTSVRRLSTVTDAYTFEFEDGAQVGVAFRRGPYYVTIALDAPAMARAEAVELLSRVADRQAAQLPSGPTGPYRFPSLAASMVLALCVTTGACLVVVGLSRIGARRRRRAIEHRSAGTEPRQRVPGDAIAVDEPARALRRRGYALLAVQIAAVDALVVGVLAILGTIDLPVWVGAVIAIGGVGAALVVTAVSGRRELAAIGGSSGRQRGRWRAPVGIVAGIVALALLAGGLVLATSGVAEMVFGPSLGGLKRAAALHVEPSQLRLATVVVGLVLLVLGGVTVRLARMWSRASATRLRQLDRRPPILYLRSFHDDALPLPSVVSARRPFLELFVPRGADPFEEAVAWELAPYGPVVAIGRPGRSLASLGAAREHLADEEWRGGVTDWMAAARAIVMAIGSTEGVHWEIGALVTNGHLAKTIFLFPPTDLVTRQERWRSTVRALRDAGAVVPPLPGDPDRALTAVLDARGQWHVAASATRDEATYRVAVDMAIAALGRRDDASTAAWPAPTTA